MRISTLFSCQYLILNFPHRVCTYENIDLLTIAHCFLIRYAHTEERFFDLSLVALQYHVKALVLVAGLIGAGDYYHHLVAAGDAAQSCSQILAVAVAHHGVDPALLGASGKGGVEGSVGLYLLALCGAAHGGVGKLEEAYQGPAAAAVVVDVEG